MREKISDLRQRLSTALRSEFERAVTQSSTRIDRAVEPYSRFVRSEQERWTDTRTTLTRLRDQARAMREGL
jgi:hypothetical protein